MDVRYRDEVRKGMNNAGMNRPATGLEISESEWIDDFDANVNGGLS
jgi:hypothetical protein